MSNTNEPNATPEQPDPKAGADAKAKARAAEERRAGGSSFEFILPDGVHSYSDLPPVEQPDPTDTGALHQAAVPPRPVAARPASNTFDFIELPDADPGSGVQKKSPVPPAAPAPTGGLISTDDVIVLPVVPVAAGDSSVALAEPLPPVDPPSFTLGGDIDLARVPDALAGAPSSKTSIPDIATLFPVGSDSNVFGAPRAAVPEVPPVPVPDSVPDLADVSLVPDVPAADPGSFVLGAEALPELDLGLPGLGSDSAILAELLPDVPAADLVDSAAVLDAIPDVPPAVPVSSGDSSAALGATLEPVAPASGWLDSDVFAGPPVVADPIAPVPVAEVFDAPAARPVESSDIFSGGRPAVALPAELSDVISATAYGPTGPPATVPASGRASEVALTFDNPPGGSTVSEPDSGELPLADEVPGSSALMDVPGSDGESIHDMPDPLEANPLFDSARLANAPDLPDVPVADAPDYGAAPDYSADASSILADLSDERPRHSGDSSSVRVEAPGVGRTVTGEAGDGTFDLTVDDEPIPAGLFDEPAAPSGPEPTDWQSQSGSDLFADKRTAPEIDLGAQDSGTVEPVDADLSSEQPSLSSAPSSIFSGPPPVADSRAGSDGAGSGSDALGGTAERAKDAPPVVPPRKAHSSGDFRLPVPAAADDDGGAIDWDSAELAGGDEATRGIPKDASLSAILKGLGDDSTESPTRDSEPVADALAEAADADEPVVTVDWMSGSSEGSAVREPEATDLELDDKIQSRKKVKDAEKPKAKPRAAVGGTEELLADAPVAKVDPKGKSRTPRAPADSGTAEKVADGAKAKPAKKGGGSLVTGLLLGTLFAGGLCAGLYYGDVIPNAKPTAQNPPPQPPGLPPGMQPPGPGQQPPPPAAPADPRAAFAAGDTKGALDLLKTNAPTDTAGKAAAGHARVFAKLQGVGTDDDLKQGRADLEAVLADADGAKTPEGLARVVQATVTLGASYEASGDVAKARALFTEAKGKYPKFADVFDGLLIKLDAPAVPGALRFTPADAERAALAALVLLAADPAADLTEPGTFYWKAVKAGADGKYTEAVDLIGQAKAAHVARAKVLAGRGLNPLTDPLEQMFPRACDELATYWKVRAELYRNPAIADAIKKDGLAKALDAFAKSQTDLATAKADAKAATDKVTKLDGDVAKLDKEVKAEKVAKADAEEKLKTALTGKADAEDKLKTATTALDAADKLVKDKDALLAQVVTELKPAVPLPDKWAPAELVAGVKSAAARATGPDLKNLVPNAMVAIGGGGLSAGQLLDIADRLKRAETAAALATAKLATETKRLSDKYDADTGKLKTDHAAEVKKLTDGYAADSKKLKDDHAALITKLKDDAADAAKKASEKFVADTKKLTDDHTAAVTKLKDDNTAAVKKLTDDHATALKAEQAKTDAEKKAAALKEIGFQKQLANAVTPAQSLDTVLPLLTDLRRPADADAALDLAKRALAAALPDSEDKAKAHTVRGMALLLKGDLAGAKDEFETARRGPAYKAAMGKAKWAAVADAGLEAVDDPLAPYRKAVVLPPTNLKVATKSLDAGIVAYKAGKYDAAVVALTDAAKNDPADPVAWYYLGATRWAQGNEEQAKKDFGQGAEREKTSGTSARTLGAALAPLQGAVRDALDRARP